MAGAALTQSHRGIHTCSRWIHPMQDTALRAYTPGHQQLLLYLLPYASPLMCASTFISVHDMSKDCYDCKAHPSFAVKIMVMTTLFSAMAIFARFGGWIPKSVI